VRLSKYKYVAEASRGHRGLLRACRKRPHYCPAAKKCDELAPFYLIELHPVPASQGRIAGYRIASDQSAGSWKARRDEPGRQGTLQHNGDS
jgi:hypothetical protein